MKNKKSLILLLVLVILSSIALTYNKPKTQTVLSFVLRGFPNVKNEYYQEYKPYSDYFGPLKIQFSTIAYQCSDKERKQAEPVVEKFEEILNYTGAKQDADMDVGELERYYYFWLWDNVAKSEYEVELVTAKFGTSSGYIWVVYSGSNMDENGELLSANGKAPCCFTVKKIDNKWTVTKIREPA